MLNPWLEVLAWALLDFSSITAAVEIPKLTIVNLIRVLYTNAMYALVNRLRVCAVHGVASAEPAICHRKPAESRPRIAAALRHERHSSGNPTLSKRQPALRVAAAPSRADKPTVYAHFDSRDASFAF